MGVYLGAVPRLPARGRYEHVLLRPRWCRLFHCVFHPQIRFLKRYYCRNPQFFPVKIDALGYLYFILNFTESYFRWELSREI